MYFKKLFIFIILLVSFSAKADDWLDQAKQLVEQINGKFAKYNNIEADQQNKNQINIDQLLASYNKNFSKESKYTGKKINSLMLFISFSMPKESLKNWIKTVNILGGDVVLAGMVNNSFHQTANLLKEFNQEQQRVIIDPTLFDQFQVATVPTLIVLPNGYFNCKKLKCEITPVHDRIAGDVSLDYALEYIKNYGAVSQKKAHEYLRQLRGDM